MYKGSTKTPLYLKTSLAPLLFAASFPLKCVWPKTPFSSQTRYGLLMSGHCHLSALVWETCQGWDLVLAEGGWQTLLLPSSMCVAIAAVTNKHSAPLKFFFLLSDQVECNLGRKCVSMCTPMLCTWGGGRPSGSSNCIKMIPWKFFCNIL